MPQLGEYDLLAHVESIILSHTLFIGSIQISLTGD